MLEVEIWPLVIIVIIVILVYIELTRPLRKCKTFDQILDCIDDNHNQVDWVRSLIVSLSLSLILLFVLRGPFPNFFTFFVVAMILFVVVYFSSAWVQAHWWRNNDYKIEKSLHDLRERLAKNGKGLN